MLAAGAQLDHLAHHRLNRLLSVRTGGTSPMATFSGAGFFNLIGALQDPDNRIRWPITSSFKDGRHTVTVTAGLLIYHREGESFAHSLCLAFVAATEERI